MILEKGKYLNFLINNRYFEPIRSLIYNYDGSINRTPNQYEVDKIIAKCRYNPRVSLGEISGENDKVV